MSRGDVAEAVTYPNIAPRAILTKTDQNAARDIMLLLEGCDGMETLALTVHEPPGDFTHRKPTCDMPVSGEQPCRALGR